MDPAESLTVLPARTAEMRAFPAETCALDAVSINGAKQDRTTREPVLHITPLHIGADL